ncbi:MAG: hypothetical protein ACE5G1_16125 [bacterium]
MLVGDLSPACPARQVIPDVPKLKYMHDNPIRKGFVEKPEDWLFSSARNYVVEDHSIVKVELLQMI